MARARLVAIFLPGQEFQRLAPASWAATLHRGGVLRMKTWPAWRASAGLAQGKTPEILRGLYVLLLSNDEPLSRVALATP